MGRSQRGLSAVGCVVDDAVYHAYLSADDVVHCLTAPVHGGEKISVVLERDEKLRRAEKGSVQFINGVVATLNQSDLIVLPENLKTTALRYPRDSLRLVTHSRLAIPQEPESSYRWRFCLMTQIAPFSSLLPQWVSYHRRIGFDHVFIFDNGAEENISAMFAGRNDVEVITWPFHKAQLQLVGWFLRIARTRCERVSHMDVDEYLMMGLGTEREYEKAPPLREMAKKAQKMGFANFKTPYILMQNQGYQHKQPGFLAELYTQLAKNQHFANGKSVCSTNIAYESGLVHSCGKINGVKVKSFKPIVKKWGDVPMYPNRRNDSAFLVHFRQRSWQEWVEKMNVGWASGVLADAVKGKLDLYNPPSSYMTVDKKLEYQHFQKVWKRVMKEGRSWENIAQMVKRDGVGCKLVKVSSGQVVKKQCG